MSKFKPTPEVQRMRDERAKLVWEHRGLIRAMRKNNALTMINGLDMLRAGHVVFDKHPGYQGAIEPLLMEARNTCIMAGFDFLFQVRTPMAECPNMTEALAGIMNEATPTMQACLDLIKEREVIAVDYDRGFRSPEQPQQKASDNDDSQNASEQGK